MPSYAYEHSKVFAALKNIQEQLPVNMTTSQYLQAYDKYLMNALTPVIVGTRFFDGFLMAIVGWQEKNFRRKVTFGNKRLVPGKVINFLLQPTPEGRLRAFAEIDLERGLRIEALEVFLKSVSLYEKACEFSLVRSSDTKPDLMFCLSYKKKIEDSLRVRVSLMTVISETRFWLEKTYDFKRLILEKYVRLCLNEARKDYISYFHHSVLLDDLIPWYLLAASRAIDKCDSRQGALASYVKSWFKSARSKAAEQRDRASAMDVNTVNLNSEEFRYLTTNPSEEEEADIFQRIETMRYLAKLCDPIGSARAYLGIEETL